MNSRGPADNMTNIKAYEGPQICSSATGGDLSWCNFFAHHEPLNNNTSDSLDVPSYRRSQIIDRKIIAGKDNVSIFSGILMSCWE
jgi:hypothetical protein